MGYIEQGDARVKNPPANIGDARDKGLIPGEGEEGQGEIPWGRKWKPAPVFLPGKSHGRRSLAGYSPWVSLTQGRNRKGT